MLTNSEIEALKMFNTMNAFGMIEKALTPSDPPNECFDDYAEIPEPHKETIGDYFEDEGVQLTETDVEEINAFYRGDI